MILRVPPLAGCHGFSLFRNGSISLFVYKYDNTGRQIGMEVVPVPVASSVTPPANAGSGDTRFFYDDHQNRVKMITTTGNVYYFVYDPTASIPAVVYEQGPANRYLNIREPDGSLISRETYDASGVRTMSRTYHFDGLGSTVALSDAGGTVTDTYTYDAWGNVTHESGSTSDNPYQYVGQLGYYTHYQEPTFGLLQLGVRYYDAGTGRFTQRDPAREGTENFNYAADTPTNATDPSGLRPRYNPPFWNKPSVCDNSNCYAYACNDPNGIWKPQPGDFSGGRGGRYRNATCTEILRHAIDDYGMQPLPKTGCPSGWHEVCLYKDYNGDVNYDYHWYRRDDNGHWSNKPGLWPITNRYAVPSGWLCQLLFGTTRPPCIDRPFLDAILRGYEKHCGCLCTKDKPWR